MQNTLRNYIPETALERIEGLLDQDQLILKILKERKTRHGDYKSMPNGKHQITVNSNLNTYRFLITLVHEIAHFETYKTFGRSVKPHGKEWKQTFQHLMLPFLNPDVFPEDLLSLLAHHFKNPKASSDTDSKLALALKQYDAPNDKNFVFEIPVGSYFKLYNGRKFQKGNKRIKRFECVEIKTGKLYLFNPNAEVELLEI
ncbi:MAG: SprT-like domain-containing protein [Bacteroidia bacterium]|nr:SprT-like domain-containing protein [Bacteroidia bacterium]MBT8279820.1 SprT-like domain-containing protein [Bacteroidia bacterium]NNK59658.1 sprT domain-containing protein [Flavobacteriaceae bacterium]NNL32971.1 sprT domain-containing protein [Flavobacteriaceae bacterium]